MVATRTGSFIGAGLALSCVFAAGAATILSVSSTPTSSSSSSTTTASTSSATSSTTSTVTAPIANPPASSTSIAFSSFDFASGTKLPDKATLWVGNATFLPGSGGTAYVPVKLDRATPNTVIARITTVNGSGSSRAISGYNYKTVEKVVIFRPGDPLEQTVEVPIIAATAGQFFQIKLREAPWGALQGQSVATVTASYAAPTAKSTGTFRAPRTFAATGTLQFELLKSTHKRSPDGGWDRWATSLSHGRTQIANEETGLYLDSSIWPGIEGPVYWGPKGLVLHTQKLAKPISYEGQNWNYGASVLDGRNFLASQIGYGQYEWDARMPTRRGSWPAFWLVSTSGWPPEIDVYEGFGQQSYWDFDRHVAHTIHGGSGGVRSFQRGAVIQAEQAYGLKGFSQDFHRFAVDIQRDYITWFVDGKETYQSVNPYRGFRWYPIMDVAVKTNSAYTDGSGDMIIRSFKIYSAP